MCFGSYCCCADRHSDDSNSVIRALAAAYNPAASYATATATAATAITAVIGAKAATTTGLTPSLRRWRADCDWLWHWRGQWSDDWFCGFKR
jgi:hypothetical protein